MVKNPLANAGDPGSIPGSGRSPGVGNSNPLQYCCLENPMDRGAWWATSPGCCRVRHDWATEYTHTYTFISSTETRLSLNWNTTVTQLCMRFLSFFFFHFPVTEQKNKLLLVVTQKTYKMNFIIRSMWHEGPKNNSANFLAICPCIHYLYVYSSVS